MNQELEQLIDLALADGNLTDKKKEILNRKAKELNVDQDEFEMVLEGKVFLKQKEMQAQAQPAQPQAAAPVQPTATTPPQPAVQTPGAASTVSTIIGNISKVESEAASGASLLNGLKNIFGI